MTRANALVLAAVLVGPTGAASARPVTLAPVAVPVPGRAPDALAVADTGPGTFVFIGDTDQIQSNALDRSTGSLTPVAVVSLANGPSALETTPDARFVLATTGEGNEVTSYRLDPRTGSLLPVDVVPSGGIGPVDIAVGKGGLTFVANSGSGTVGTIRLDPKTGSLSPVSLLPVGKAPTELAAAGRTVVVGDAATNQLLVLRLSPKTGLLTPGGSATLGSPVTGLDVQGRDVVAGTEDGLVHYYRLRSDQLVARGTFDTGDEVTDVTLVGGGPLDWTTFATGRSSLRALMWTNDGIRDLGRLPLADPASDRDLVTVVGKQKITYVVANESDAGQTRVFAARRAPRGTPTTSSSTTSSTSSSTTSTNPATGGVTPVPVDKPEGIYLVGARIFGGIGAARLVVLVAGENGFALVDGVTGEVLKAFVVPFPSPLYGGHPLAAFRPTPAIVTGAQSTDEPELQAVVQVGPAPNSPAVTGYDPTTGEFGFTQVSPGTSICLDSVPYAGDPLSGGAVVSCGRAIQTLEPDAGFTSFGGGTTYGGFPMSGGPVFSGFRRRAGGPIVAISDGGPGMPGTLWRHPATGAIGETPEPLGATGNSPRRVRCAGNVCALSNFGSDSLTVVTWDAADAVAIAGTVAVGDGPTGIDVRPRGDGNVEVVSTGFNDDSYSVTVLRPDGSTVSNQKRAVPTGCAAPGHAVWGTGNQIVVSCNESDAIAVIAVP